MKTPQHSLVKMLVLTSWISVNMNTDSQPTSTPINSLPVGVDIVDVNDVVVVVTILHTTWEGSGLHLPDSIHTALKLDGANSDCRHW